MIKYGIDQEALISKFSEASAKQGDAIRKAVTETTLKALQGRELTLAGFFGLAYSIYPYVVLDRLTVWQAASSPEALKVILLGACISVPAIAGYTVFSYRVFRGKTGELKYA